MVCNTKSVTINVHEILFILILSFLFNSRTEAQIAGEGQKFSLGVRMGGGVSWAAFSDKAQKDTFSVLPAPGYSVGGFINFPLKNDFLVQMEFGYSKKGRIVKDVLHLTNTSTYQFVDATMLLRK